MVKEAVTQNSNVMRKAIIDNKDIIDLHSKGFSSSKMAIMLNTSTKK